MPSEQSNGIATQTYLVPVTKYTSLQNSAWAQPREPHWCIGRMLPPLLATVRTGAVVQFRATTKPPLPHQPYAYTLRTFDLLCQHVGVHCFCGKYDAYNQAHA